MLLGKPKIEPVLDPQFVPAANWIRDFNRLVESSETSTPFAIALQQPNGTCVSQRGSLLPEHHAQAPLNNQHVERLLKALLWTAGGNVWYWDGPSSIFRWLEERFEKHPCGVFDRDFMERVYKQPFRGVQTQEIPTQTSVASPLGRHLKGNRIGFDLGGSDRKVAAVVDGKVIFSEEVPWDPYHKADPDYHRSGIMDSLERAATHLPKVDAIGGSSAGVFVDNRPRVASLFRGINDEDFVSKVETMFLEIGEQLGVPIAIINDGDVTALAASMSLDINSVMGLAMGTSQAVGYVDKAGCVTGWLNELAFAPVDYSENAPADEWSGDVGCGVQYFSQQAVGRLIQKTNLAIDPGLGLPEKLVSVQEAMAKGEPGARDIYQTIGVYLGYAAAHYARFYDLDHLLILGRVTSGEGGDVILSEAQKVLNEESASDLHRITFHQPDEKNKRHGQAIAAASLVSISE